MSLDLTKFGLDLRLGWNVNSEGIKITFLITYYHINKQAMPRAYSWLRMRGLVRGLGSSGHLMLVDVDLKLVVRAATQKRESPGLRITYELTAFLYHLKLGKEGRGECQLSGVHSFTINKTSCSGMLTCFHSRVSGVGAVYALLCLWACSQFQLPVIMG